MLSQIFKDYNIVLGSNSPRRKQYMQDLQIPFTVRASDIDETYPSTLQREAITDFIANAKSQAIPLLAHNEIIITSDTTVWNNHTSLGKPVDRQEAYTMIKGMSGKQHEVITSVCLRSKNKIKIFNCITKVDFIELSDEAIYFYIDTYKPYDKAGAYGIQEWIGLIGISKIDGSYTNIVGLPTTELVQELIAFIKE
ncbi:MULTISPECIES: Maf family nucleotide pyrophosphatase [Myroides]|uniref:dTTP/UTP pyrophosphatase n=1 Tax=Myroides albus TaxID=2562892 RepID=A0A6I3LJ06_9FLAO|nr:MULTISPECIES: Maf family nucleotide pyrophosphatase [Myroides]MTG97160.1 septum formation protein Maf [Myroides albus]MVX35157.1 septum formation protein Maf [Myroides sp. LoEW2-1]UVD78902.1 Maf family nucleotide pyrophosphatase [Myroides albus]